MDIYRLKTVKYQNTQRKILLQNENGPCPLLAATNALLLRGVISLPQSCVRSMTATTNDVVNVLADRALKRCREEDFAAQHATEWKTVGGDAKGGAAKAAPDDDDDDGIVVVDDNKAKAEGPFEFSGVDSTMQSHLNDLLFLFPSLQYGLDVNPRFCGGPTGVEYTKNVAVFDLLGVELVHGWLLDPQDVDTAELVGRKTYNELIEMVIRGKDAAAELETVEQSMNRKRAKLNRMRNPNVCEAPPVDEGFAKASADEEAKANATNDEDWIQVGDGETDEPRGARKSPPDVEEEEEEEMKKMPPQEGNDNGQVTQGKAEEGVSEDGSLEKSGLTDEANDAKSPVVDSQVVDAKLEAEERKLPANQETETAQEAPGSGETQSLDADQLPQQEVLSKSHPADPGGAVVPDEKALSRKDPPPEAELEGEAVSKDVPSEAAFASAVASAAPEEEEHFPEQFVNFIRRKDPPPEAAMEEGSTPEPTLRRKDPPPEAELEGPSPDGIEVLESSIATLGQKFDELSAVAMKGTVIDQFLTSTGHQLTYYGLHELHRHLAEECLCVFFRNNHFATVTKHRDVLYLLVTDLGYANIEEVMWEKLDAIDGDTEYADSDFVKPPPRETLQIEQTSGLSPEQLHSQDGVTAADHQLALQLSGAAGHAKTQAELDDDEGRLVAAAMEDSLRELHLAEEGTEGVYGTSEEEKKPSAYPAAAASMDHDYAMDDAVHALLEKEAAEAKAQEEADAAMARQLQEEESRAAQAEAPSQTPSPRHKNPANSTGNGDRRTTTTTPGRNARANGSPSQSVGVGRVPPFGRPLAAGGTDPNKEKCVIS